MHTPVATLPAEGRSPGLAPYDLFMLVICALSLLVLIVDSLLVLRPEIHDVLGIADTALCAIFLFDFGRNLRRANDRGRYMLRSGWLDLLSSIPALEILRVGRLSRIVRIIRLIRALRSVRAIGQVITRHRAESAVLAALTMSILLVFFASVGILQFERGPEANILTGGDALWWAVTTITAAGYGDRFPVTLEGRIVAAMLMAAGIGLFGIVSGIVASWFLHGDHHREVDEIALLRHEIERLRERLESASAHSGGETEIARESV